MSEHYPIAHFFYSSITFRDPDNQKLVTQLVKEVQGMNPSFIAADIRSKELVYDHNIIENPGNVP